MHIGGVQQHFYLWLAQRFGDPQGLFGRQHAQGRIGLHNTLAQRPAKVAFEHRQTAIRRSGFGDPMFNRKVLLQMRLGGLVQAQALFTQPVCKEAQVTAVSGQRVGRQTILQPEGVNEAIDRTLALGQHQSSDQSSC